MNSTKPKWEVLGTYVCRMNHGLCSSYIQVFRRDALGKESWGWSVETTTDLVCVKAYGHGPSLNGAKRGALQDEREVVAYCTKCHRRVKMLKAQGVLEFVTGRLNFHFVRKKSCVGSRKVL